MIQRTKSRAYELAGEPGGFYADQFGSRDVRSGYAPMGWEIAKDLDGGVDVLVAPVGASAALMGAADGLEKKGVTLKIVAFEPLQSPRLTTGVGGAHHVEGIGVGFEPPCPDRDRRDDIRAIDGELACDMCRELARRAGVFCGRPPAVNVVSAIELAKDSTRGSAS